MGLTNEATTKIRELNNHDIEELIDLWIHSSRDRKILKRRLIDNICFDSIACEFDMSDRQVKQIVYDDQKVLLKHLSDCEHKSLF